MKRCLVLMLVGLLIMGIASFAVCYGAPKNDISSKPVTLTILSSIATEQEGSFEKSIAEEYMKLHKNVKINFIATPANELVKKIIVMNSSGDLPDAFYMPSEFLPQAESMNIVIDPKKYLGSKFMNSLASGIVDASSINEHLAFVPWHIIPIALIYRADWLKESGIKKIETWDDFSKAAKAFTKDTDGDGKIDRWGFSMVGTRNASGENRFLAMAKTFGVDEIYKDKNGKWQTGLTTPQFQTAITYFTNLALKEGVVPPGPTETGYPEASAFFAQEKTGLMISGSNAIGAIINANPKLNGKLASVPLPKGKRHISILQASGYSITRASKNPAVCADYLKFMTQKQTSIEFGKKFGRMPVTKEAVADPSFNAPAFQGFTQAMKYGYVIPPFPSYTQVIDLCGEAYTSIMANKVPVGDALKVLSDKMAKILQENNK